MFRVELTHFTSRMLNMTMRPNISKTLFNFSSFFEAIRNSWLMIVKILWLQVYNKITYMSTWKLEDIMKKPFTFMTSIWDLNLKLTRREAATSGIQKTLILRCNRLKVIHQTYGKVLTSKTLILRCSIFITHRYR